MSETPIEHGGSSGLYYNGTREEVRLGDRVRIRRLFRRNLEGIVCYIPGISPRHEDLEYEDIHQWAIEADNGSVYPILYDPQNFQPPSRISLIERTSIEGLTPDETLE